MKRILAVDDDAAVLELEKKILIQEGYEVQTVGSGAEALLLLKENDYDLILLDIMMPGIDGIEVSQMFHDVDAVKKPPVVFVTAKDDAETMREGFRAGGTIFLSKPFTSRQLLQVVQAVVH